MRSVYSYEDIPYNKWKALRSININSGSFLRTPHIVERSSHNTFDDPISDYLVGNSTITAGQFTLSATEGSISTTINLLSISSTRK